MNFQLAGTGKSFKGAFAYYLHDKRQDPAAPHLTTSERVAWMEVRNLAVDDPAYVQGVMIATARNAEQIKRDAGIKATGRKATGGAVFSYSIQWHPENETIPDRAGMIEAADATLKLLGADGRQAAIICHIDTAHPHVHIVVNRVDPSTGKMLVLEKNAYKLDEWAAKYERERGQIVSPNRDAKHEARKQREQEQGKTAVAPVPAFTKATTPPPLPQERPKTKAALLAEEGAAQKARHKEEWAALATANKARRAAVTAERIDFKAIAAAHRAETRPQWSELGKAQAAARRDFARQERDLFGIVWNAARVAAAVKQSGDHAERGILSLTFGYVLSSHARAGAFQDLQQREKAAVAARSEAELMAKFAAAKREQAGKLAAVRQTYDRDRAELITRQDLEKARIRDGWRNLTLERQKLADHADRSRARMEQRGSQNYRHGRRLDRQIPPAIDSQAKAPGPIERRAPGQPPPASSPPRPVDATGRAHVDHRPNFSGHNQAKPPALPFPPIPQQEPQPVKPDFERAGQLPVAKQSPPPPERRPQLPAASPVPSPSGDVPPRPTAAQSVPKVDRVKDWANSAEGQRVVAAQAPKAAPDALRTKAAPAFQPPAPPAPASPARDHWRQQAAPLAPANPTAAPARDFWKKNAEDVTRPKIEHDRKPKPSR